MLSANRAASSGTYICDQPVALSIILPSAYGSGYVSTPTVKARIQEGIRNARFSRTLMQVRIFIGVLQRHAVRMNRLGGTTYVLGEHPRFAQTELRTTEWELRADARRTFVATSSDRLMCSKTPPQHTMEVGAYSPHSPGEVPIHLSGRHCLYSRQVPSTNASNKIGCIRNKNLIISCCPGRPSKCVQQPSGMHTAFLSKFRCTEYPCP